MCVCVCVCVCVCGRVGGGGGWGGERIESSMQIVLVLRECSVSGC